MSDSGLSAAVDMNTNNPHEHPVSVIAANTSEIVTVPTQETTYIATNETSPDTTTPASEGAASVPEPETGASGNPVVSSTDASVQATVHTDNAVAGDATEAPTTPLEAEAESNVVTFGVDEDSSAPTEVSFCNEPIVAPVDPDSEAADAYNADAPKPLVTPIVTILPEASLDADTAHIPPQGHLSRPASQVGSSRHPTPPNEPAPTTSPSLRSTRTLLSSQSTLSTPMPSNGEKNERKPANFLATLHTPSFAYKSLKDLEADNAAFNDDLSKFKKAQAAQRSLQWQFDELTRLFSKTETTQQQLSTDYGNLFKEKDLYKRHLKTMNREIDRLHFAVLDAQDQREELRGEFEAMLEEAAREREAIARERDEWKQRVEDMAAQMKQAEEDHAKQLAEECTRHKASISDGLNREAELTRALEEKEQNLAKCEGELTLERKATRGLRHQLQEVQRYSEELKAHNDNLSTKLAEAQQTIIELRPWEVRYHGLHDRSSKQENDQKTRLDGLTQENGQIKTLLKHLVMMMFGMGIKYRVQICGALSRVSALLINVTAQVSKLSGQVSPRSIEAFEHDLSHQLERKKHEVSQLLTGIKKHSVLSLLDALDTEVAKVAEPVEALVQRVWVLHHTCNSLQQNSIQKTCDFMATMEEHELLKQNYKHAMEEWKRSDTLYKREQSDKANLMSRINILEREIAQHNRNRRYAQSIESLMKEHAKYQNLQEQIALMRRRVDLLKGEKREEEAKLSHLQENSDNVQNMQERETQSQYNMSKPVMLPPYSPNKSKKKDPLTSTTAPHAKYGADGVMLPRVQSRASTHTQQQLSQKQMKARQQYRDISPSRDSTRSRSYSKLPLTEAKMAEVENIYIDQGRK